MQVRIWETLSAVVCLGFAIACGTFSNPITKEDGYYVCKFERSDGSTSDNCPTSVLENESCSENQVKVKSEKPASDYMCATEL